jgi:sporulation related protein
MLRRRRSEGKNWTKGLLAFFWIVLAAFSALYLFTLFANPTAFGRQTASLGDGTSALTGSTTASLTSDQVSELLEARDKELAEIKQAMRDLSQQVADLSARINPSDKNGGPLASTAPPSPASAPPPEPAAAAAAPVTPAKKPEVVAAAPAITPPPPPEKPTPVVKPADAKPAEKPAPVTVAAAEPKPVEKAEPKPAAAPPPPVTTSEPGDNDADAKKDIPPPVTVSEADVPPVEDASPSGADASSPSPETPNQTPAGTESASLDPVALPPAANDGTTRYGIEIGTVAKQDALRPLWREFLTNHGALVAGLQPRRVLAPDKKWRLIAGPFANAAEAEQACALFKKASRPCAATVYAGDSL